MMLPTLEKLLNLDQHITLALNGSDSLFLDNVIMAITQTVTWIPMALVLIYVLIRNNNMQTLGLLLLMLGLCILFSDQMSSSFTKPYFARFRPTQDPQIMYLVDVVDGYRGGKYGFFSSHAANTFSITIFLSLLFRYRPVILGLLSWTLLNCYSRIYLGVHYVGDVLMGIVWGSIVGTLLYFVSKRMGLTPSNGNTTADDYFTKSGYQISTMHLFLYALLLTYVLIIISAVKAC
ncbi:MAG: phosphatase PAP2 family protein [Bacteroidaceae bacterium]